MTQMPMSQVNAEQWKDYLPARVQGVVGSVPAATSVNEEPGFFGKENLMEMGQYGVPFVPFGGGYVLGGALSFGVAENRAKKELGEMANQYRDQVSQVLHIPPQMVNEQALLIAAQHNEGLGKAVQSIHDEQDKHPLKNGVGLAGMAAGTAAAMWALAPATGGMSLVVGGIGAMAGSWVGESVGDAVLTKSDMKDPRKLMQHFMEKQAGGKAITAEDVFVLRLAQNDGLSDKIVAEAGQEFHELDAKGRMEVMQKYAPLTQMCQSDAMCCAQPGANMSQLMVGAMQPSMMQMNQTQPWAQRVGGSMKPIGGFMDRVRQQQAAVQVDQNQI